MLLAFDYTLDALDGKNPDLNVIDPTITFALVDMVILEPICCN